MAETNRGCIVAYTSEDGRYDAVRIAAVELARRSDADLILYDIDAAPAFVGESPLPTAWSGQGSDKQWPNRLTPDDLERAGRHGVAEQVQSARDAGVQAFAWLPEKRDSTSLASYAEQEGAHTILLPASHESPSFAERLRGETVGKLADQSNLRIALVRDDGTVEDAAESAAGGALSRG